MDINTEIEIEKILINLYILLKETNFNLLEIDKLIKESCNSVTNVTTVNRINQNSISNISDIINRLTLNNCIVEKNEICNIVNSIIKELIELINSVIFDLNKTKILFLRIYNKIINNNSLSIRIRNQKNQSRKHDMIVNSI